MTHEEVHYFEKANAVLKDDDKWNKRYLSKAKSVAGWSKDPSTQVGAVAYGIDGEPLSEGYNGFPRAILDTDSRLNNREEKYKFTIHAEANMVYNACLAGTSLKGATAYVYGLPVCMECAKALIQVGIKCVVMGRAPGKKNDPRWETTCRDALALFKEARVEYWVYDETDGSGDEPFVLTFRSSKWI